MCWWASGKTSGPSTLLILWDKDLGIVEEVGGTVTTVHPGNWAAVSADVFSQLFKGWNDGVIKAAISCVEAEK